MNGPASAPPPQLPLGAPKSVIGWRVLFTALPVLTCSVLAWAAMLRLAIHRRRKLDWVLFAAVVIVEIIGFILIDMSHRDDDWQLNTGAGLLVLNLFAVPVYFCTADIVFHRRATRPSPAIYGYPPVSQQMPLIDHRFPYPTALPSPPYPAQPLGSYPPPASPPPPAIPPPPPVPGPMAPPSPSPGAGAPPAMASPLPRPATPQRIDRVREELDELSDYLRKHDAQPDRPLDPRPSDEGHLDQEDGR